MMIKITNPDNCVVSKFKAFQTMLLCSDFPMVVSVIVRLSFRPGLGPFMLVFSVIVFRFLGLSGPDSEGLDSYRGNGSLNLFGAVNKSE